MVTVFVQERERESERERQKKKGEIKHNVQSSWKNIWANGYNISKVLEQTILDVQFHGIKRNNEQLLPAISTALTHLNILQVKRESSERKRANGEQRKLKWTEANLSNGFPGWENRLYLLIRSEFLCSGDQFCCCCLFFVFFTLGFWVISELRTKGDTLPRIWKITRVSQ